MTLTYPPAEGMQHIARSARNTWSVIALGEARSELRIDAEVDLSPTGRALALVLRPYLAAMGRRNADDLKVYAETGGPSQRKQRQQSGSGPLADLVAANAAFTTARRRPHGRVGLVGEPVRRRSRAGRHGPRHLPDGVRLYLAWVSGRGVSARTGHTLALLDASWVVGTAVALTVSGHEFSAVGLTASVATAAIVAGSAGHSGGRAGAFIRRRQSITLQRPTVPSSRPHRAGRLVVEPARLVTLPIHSSSV